MTEYLAAQVVKVEIQTLGLGQHLVFLFFDVMPDIFREHRELGIVVILAAVHLRELSDKDLCYVMFLIGLVHHLFSELLTNCGVKQLLLDCGVDLELQERGLSVASVRGNHEEMCLQAGADHYYRDLWQANGGLYTLASFEADGVGDISARYRGFLESLPFYILLEEFVIVHAGLNFDTQEPFADTEAMLWTRSPFVDRQRIGGRRLICGHTPVTRLRLEASLNSSKIMLDNGCVFGGRPEMGNLAALELESMTLFLQPNIDR